MRPSRRTAICAAALPLLALLGGTAAQADSTPVRSGSHEGYGRVVIDTPPHTDYRVERDGDCISVHVVSDVPLGGAPAPPRNVKSIQTNGNTLTLTLAPNARLQQTRVNGHIVLDAALGLGDARPLRVAAETASPGVTRAPTAAPVATRARTPKPRRLHESTRTQTRTTARAPTPAASAAALVTKVAFVALPTVKPSQPTVPQLALPSSRRPDQPLDQPPDAPPTVSTAARVPVSQEPVAAEMPRPQADAQTGPQADPSTVPEPSQPQGPGRDAMPEAAHGPVSLRARRVKLPPEMAGSGFLVPFPLSTAAAAFRIGDSSYIVFDTRLPVDMAAFKDDPAFGAAFVQMLPAGTLLRLPHPDSKSLVLTQLPHGWRVALVNRPLRLEPISAVNDAGQLALAADLPGNVVEMTSPDTGAILLIGTQHRPGQGIANRRRSSDFILHRSLQGIVVEPLSDNVEVHPSAGGFTLSGGPAGLALSPQTLRTAALIEAAHLTRRLNFNPMPRDALFRRAEQQLNAAASVPPGARGRYRHAAAESLLSLGFAAEAQGLLKYAAEQDPREAASLDTKALTAVAALLAGRTDESAGIDDPALSGTDDITFWRAIRQATLDEGSPAAAAIFTADAPLALQYPEPIRDRIMPLIAETMVQGGALEPAKRMLDLNKDDHRLDYARALMAEAEGRTGDALLRLDALTRGHDQFDRARASKRAVELRLASGALTKAQAADALDKLLYAWRGDQRELAMRERVAELRAESGLWRASLDILRQAEADFPDQAADIQRKRLETFAAMVRDQDIHPVSPFEFVAMADEDAAFISADDGAVEQDLADRLLALDLPDRARPVLKKLMESATSPAAKARFGGSLAALEAREGNDKAAMATLDASSSDDLPADLAEHRALTRATAMAHLGDPAGAASSLEPFRSAEAMETRAQILEAVGKWDAAEQAWAGRAAEAVPAEGTLDETAMRVLVRLATAATRAGDTAALAGLRDKYSGRLGSGAMADMFKLLTADSVKSSTDLPRSRGEMAVAAGLPRDLSALEAKSAPK